MCRTPKGPVRRYCNLPARSLGYYRQSGFLFCPPQLKDLLASLAPVATASGRYGSFLLTSLSVRPSPILQTIQLFLSAALCRPFVRSFVHFLRVHFYHFIIHAPEPTTTQGGEKGGRVHDQQWTVRRLSQFGSTQTSLDFVYFTF